MVKKVIPCQVPSERWIGNVSGFKDSAMFVCSSSLFYFPPWWLVRYASQAGSGPHVHAGLLWIREKRWSGQWWAAEMRSQKEAWFEKVKWDGALFSLGESKWRCQFWVISSMWSCCRDEGGRLSSAVGVGGEVAGQGAPALAEGTYFTCGEWFSYVMVLHNCSDLTIWSGPKGSF